ncbi:MAG: hypothetical protein AAGH87_04475 [Pseudomonadota bacterium]
MDTKLKRWTQLGLGAAFATSALAACGGETAPTETAAPEAAAPETVADAPDMTDPAPAASAGEGEGEGGEGEGGVAVSAAASNPVVYMSALAITEAHIIAARDAFAAGETEAASEMFAHPVSEVLADMGPVFEQRGVESFSQLLLDASGAIFDGEDEAQINARADEILAAIAAAGEKAPDDGSSQATIAAGVAADQIERATDMYRTAAGTDRYEPYLDGYGFFKAGEAAFLASEAAIDAENSDTAGAIRAALGLLDGAYPTALRPAMLDADQSALTVAASEVVLAVQN